MTERRFKQERTVSHFYVLVVGDVDHEMEPFNLNAKVFPSEPGVLLFDSYGIGGRYAGRLVDHEGRASSQLRKSDIDFEGMKRQRVLAAPEGTAEASVAPFALLNERRWHKRTRADDDWEARFEALFTALPDDVMLTVVDCHS